MTGRSSLARTHPTLGEKRRGRGVARHRLGQVAPVGRARTQPGEGDGDEPPTSRLSRWKEVATPLPAHLIQQRRPAELLDEERDVEGGHVLPQRPGVVGPRHEHLEQTVAARRRRRHGVGHPDRPCHRPEGALTELDAGRHEACEPAPGIVVVQGLLRGLVPVLQGQQREVLEQLLLRAIAAIEAADADTGPRRDFLLLNAGYATYAAGLSDSPEQGIALATETLESGAAARKLADIVVASNALE